jgi:16S rRNA (adenine1518-N6/adenine1519-N6)-dimethyltransferase
MSPEFFDRRRKRLGQHFLRHPGAVRRIVEAAELSPTDTVVEVGAGTGILTAALAAAAGRVLAIEVDEGLIPKLEARLEAAGVAGRVEVVREDILRFDWAGAAAQYGPLKVVGNLPYSISTPVMFRLLEHRRLIPLAVLMFQREVAYRIAAAPGGKDYGILSVLIQQAAVARRVMDLEAKHFQPPPKVRSAVLKIAFPAEPPWPVKDEAVFTRVVKAAFGQRRKTLHNALRALGLPGEALEAAMGRAGIDPRLRAEQLSLADFTRLADSVGEAAGTSVGTSVPLTES